MDKRPPSLIAKIFADALSPFLSRWSYAREQSILKSGEPLPGPLLEFATELGIESPESLRLEITHRIPHPVPELWIGLARKFGLPVFAPAGMCLGRGISAISTDPILLRHELVHTLQYQTLGGHQPFLWRYVFECLLYGYASAPLEIEARERSS